MLRTGSSASRFGATGCVILPVSLFVGVMIAGPGTAIFPAVSTWSAPLACSGTVEVDSSYYTTQQGGNGVSRTISCVTGEGKTGARDDITWQAMGIAFLIYSALAFLIARFLVAPWLRRRTARTLEAAGIVSPADPARPASSADLKDIFARVSEAVARGEANVVVRNVTMDASNADLSGLDLSGAHLAGGDPAQRLAQLRQLRDQGLISAEDYEAKKGEILSGL